MNDAVKYFQENGLQRSKELVEMGFGFCSLEDGLSFHTEQLKRLIESHELVGRYGTADEAKEYLPMLRIDSYDELKQAIADVESCMEVKSDNGI